MAAPVATFMYIRWAWMLNMRVWASRRVTPVMPTKSTAATPARAKAGATAVSDSGVAGPGSASEKLVATNVAKRGSTGVSNSPTRSGLPPALRVIPSRAGVSAGSMPGRNGWCHGTVTTLSPTPVTPSMARRVSSMASRPVQAHSKPNSLRCLVVSIRGWFRTYSKSPMFTGDSFRSQSSVTIFCSVSAFSRTTRRPRAAATCSTVKMSSGPRFTGPVGPDSQATAKKRPTSSACTTCHRPCSPLTAATTGPARRFRTRLSMRRPTTMGARMATSSTSAEASRASTSALHTA